MIEDGEVVIRIDQNCTVEEILEKNGQAYKPFKEKLNNHMNDVNYQRKEDKGGNLREQASKIIKRTSKESDKLRAKSQNQLAFMLQQRQANEAYRGGGSKMNSDLNGV